MIIMVNDNVIFEIWLFLFNITNYFTSFNFEYHLVDFL